MQVSKIEILENRSDQMSPDQLWIQREQSLKLMSFLKVLLEGCYWQPRINSKKLREELQ